MAEERGSEFIENEQLGPDKTEVIGLREALAMLEEMEAEDSVVLGIIDDALSEAIPKLDDREGWEAFNSRMQALAQYALTLDGVTSRGRLIKEKIQSRIAELEKPAT